MANISVSEMRIAVSRVYSGRRWKIKVDNMSDRQVMALYYRFYHSGQLEKAEESPKKESGREVERPTFEPYRGEQMKFEGL